MNRKRKMWGCSLKDDVLIIGTPLFFLVLCCGGIDYLRDAETWEFNLFYGRMRDPKPGSYLWTHRFRHVLRSTPRVAF